MIEWKKISAKNPVCQILVQCLPFKIYEGMCRQTEANLTKTNPSQLPEKSFTNAFLLQTCQKNICHLWWHLKVCCIRCWFCTFQRISIIFGGIWKYVVYAAFWVAGSCRLIEKSNWRTNTGSPYLPTPACLLSQKYKHKNTNKIQIQI